MQTKQLFAKFWQRYHNVEEKPSQPICTEPPEDYPSLPVAGGSASDPLFALLSHDDICHAAGILRPRSAYDIDKIVEMLHSDHMCGLPDEIKRASVLMAIEATGSSVHDILQYATRRQEALDAYETAQRKQFADFEARKMQENAQSGAELARVTAHYAERIRGNERLLAAGKDAFRNWRKAKRTESQRIAEVLELCARKPAADPPVQVKARAAAASAGANGITTARLPRPTLPPEPPAVRPN